MAALEASPPVRRSLVRGDARRAHRSPAAGAGKTLAAFLIALDELLRESLTGALPDEVRVVYVSPLKALSADIHKNLAEPRAAIRRLARDAGSTRRPSPRPSAAATPPRATGPRSCASRRTSW